MDRTRKSKKDRPEVRERKGKGEVEALGLWLGHLERTGLLGEKGKGGLGLGQREGK